MTPAAFKKVQAHIPADVNVWVRANAKIVASAGVDAMAEVVRLAVNAISDARNELSLQKVKLDKARQSYNAACKVLRVASNKG